MEVSPSSMADNLKELIRSRVPFLKSLNNNPQNNNSQNPVDMLKRFQRQAFSELMKLRDRQEKLEKMLMYQKIGKESPFQETGMFVKATFSAMGSLLLFEDDFLVSANRLEKCSTRTGVNSRLTFETMIRERDSLVAEFCTTSLGSLGFNKLMYHANINDLFSLVVAPKGPRCNDFRIKSCCRQGDSDELHASGSSIFHQYHDCAAGVILKGLNFGASLAQLVSGPSKANGDSDMDNCHFTTFGQIAYKPLEDLKISLSSIWQHRRSSSRLVRISNLTVPLIHLNLKRSRHSEVPIDSYGNDSGTGISNSVALMMDGDFKSSKLEGWIEVDGLLSERLINFGVSFSDMPENELGWGLSVGGEGKGSLLRKERFQIEGFLNFDLGTSGNAKLQPGVMFVTEAGSRVAALVLRSSWSM